MNEPTGPYTLSEEDVARSSTLESSDIGRIVLIVGGCYVFYDNADDAREDRDIMCADMRKRKHTEGK